MSIVVGMFGFIGAPAAFAPAPAAMLPAADGVRSVRVSSPFPAAEVAFAEAGGDALLVPAASAAGVLAPGGLAALLPFEHAAAAATHRANRTD